MAKEKGTLAAPRTMSSDELMKWLNENSKNKQPNIVRLQSFKKTLLENKSLEWLENCKGTLIFFLLINLCNEKEEIRNIIFEVFEFLIPFLEKERQTVTTTLDDSQCDITKQMIDLIKQEHSSYTFKIWTLIIKILDKTLHKNRNMINKLLIVLEKTFKQGNPPSVQTASFSTWKVLIDNFALEKEILVNPKRMKLLMQPLISSKSLAEETNLEKFDAWWHLAYRLEENLLSEFSTVCLPMLNKMLTIPSSETSSTSLPSPAARNINRFSDPAQYLAVQLKGCQVLFRLLEMPVSLASPKKAPTISLPALKEPLPNKLFITHSHELLRHARTVLNLCKDNRGISEQYLLNLLLRRMTSIHNEEPKESLETVSNFLNFFHTILKDNCLDSNSSLKLLDEISRALPTSTLSSHNLRSPSDSPGSLESVVPAYVFLKLLVKKDLFTKVYDQHIFMAVFSKFVGAGAQDKISFLKFLHSVFCLLEGLFVENLELPLGHAEVLSKMWFEISTTLFKKIEETQDINTGDSLEHNFSTLLAAMVFPSKLLLRQSQLEMLSTNKDSKELKLWENICRALFRYSALIDSLEPNICCEEYCQMELELLDESSSLTAGLHFWMWRCSCLEILIDSIDFQSLNCGSRGLLTYPDIWRKKNSNSLGVLHSFVNLLNQIVSSSIKFQEPMAKKSLGKRLTTHQRNCMELISLYLKHLGNSEIILNSLTRLGQVLVPLFKLAAAREGGLDFNQKLEEVWNSVVTVIKLRYIGDGGQILFDVLCPLLEETLTHPVRGICEKSRELWLSRFASLYASLTLSDRFKQLLNNVKPFLLSPNDLSPQDDISEVHDSVDDISCAQSSPVKFGSFLNKGDNDGKANKAATFVDSPRVSPEKFKKPLSEMKDDEFVKIDSPKNLGRPKVLTDHQKEVYKEKRFVPALYSDLSQDTQKESPDLFDSNDTVPATQTITITDSPEAPASSPKGFNDTKDQDSQDSDVSQTQLSNVVDAILIDLDNDAKCDAAEYGRSVPNETETEDFIVNETQEDLITSQMETDGDRISALEETVNEMNNEQMDVTEAAEDSSSQLAKTIVPNVPRLLTGNEIVNELEEPILVTDNNFNESTSVVEKDLMEFSSVLEKDSKESTSVLEKDLKESTSVLEKDLKESISIKRVTRRTISEEQPSIEGEKQSKLRRKSSSTSKLVDKSKSYSTNHENKEVKILVSKLKTSKVCSSSSKVSEKKSVDLEIEKDNNTTLAKDVNDKDTPTSTELLNSISAPSSETAIDFNEPLINLDKSKPISEKSTDLISTIDLTDSSQSQNTEESTKKRGRRKRKLSSSSEVPSKRISSAQEVLFDKNSSDDSERQETSVEPVTIDPEVENFKENKNPELETKQIDSSNDEKVPNKVTGDKENLVIETHTDVTKEASNSFQPEVLDISGDPEKIESTPNDAERKVSKKTKDSLSRSLGLSTPKTRQQKRSSLGGMISLRSKSATPGADKVKNTQLTPPIKLKLSRKVSTKTNKKSWDSENVVAGDGSESALSKEAPEVPLDIVSDVQNKISNLNEVNTNVEVNVANEAENISSSINMCGSSSGDIGFDGKRVASGSEIRSSTSGHSDLNKTAEIDGKKDATDSEIGSSVSSFGDLYKTAVDYGSFVVPDNTKADNLNSTTDSVFEAEVQSSVNSPLSTFSKSHVGSPHSLSRSQKMVQAAINKKNSGSPTQEKSNKTFSSPKSSSKPSTSSTESPSTGILKLKRRKPNSESKNSKSPSPTNKQRRVSFADPLTTKEWVVETKKRGSSSRRLQLLTSELNPENEDERPVMLPDEESQMTGEISISQNDGSVSGKEPIYPVHVDCKCSVEMILSSLTSSFWAKDLKELLGNKNIETIGNLCSLTSLDVKNLPIRSPKKDTILKVLVEHCETCTQSIEATNGELKGKVKEPLITKNIETKVEDVGDENMADIKDGEDLIDKYLSPEKVKPAEIVAVTKKNDTLYESVSSQNEEPKCNASQEAASSKPNSSNIKEVLASIDSEELSKEMLSRVRDLSTSQMTKFLVAFSLEVDKALNK